MAPPSAPPVITLKDIRLTFGGTPLMTGIDLQVAPGDRIGLVGRNGSGKSTLLKIVAALVEPDLGERFIQPGLNVQYLAQEPDMSGYRSLAEFAESGFADGDDPYRARLILNELGLTGEENPASVSGGEARRTAIARALAPRPDVLLLDEPTNHLDLPAIEWLEAELASFRGAIVLISHDRRFLENLTRATVWIDRGVARRLDRGFDAFEAWRDEVLEQEELDRHKLDRQIVREQHWMHGGVTGRRKRNMRRVAELADMRKRRREDVRPTGRVRMDAAEAQASGKLVIEAKGLTKAFGDTVVVHDFSTRIARGNKIGLVGPNGAGKTTLLKMLIGELEPDSGTVRLGANLETVTLDQHREALDPDTTLADAMTGGRGDMVTVNGTPRHVASYMKDFLFQPEQIRSPLKVLSGGERARLMLARALAKPSNLLVLDEPTNDLDLETLDLLQELVADYGGTVLIVSHDRDFLDRTVESVIVAEGGGHWVEYAGGYSDMRNQQKLAADQIAEQPPLAADKPREPATPTSAKPQRKQSDTSSRKLSFKDKHALETLPGTIAALENEA
ncbi:MAG: ABC-F family ATP-binding cassette domain-containing protein, partial [Hyphomicrobiaceae bacterium]|nr:ABC-F family ATP-binding cassette domain-containing protein [Hyphomicrobiaceae bacterium]